MKLESEELDAIIEELAPLIGGRVQRVDVVDVRELVIELRRPGKTFRLLVSGRSEMGRVHLVERRPPKLVPVGGLQSTLRTKLTGRPISRIERAENGVLIEVPGTRLTVRFGGKKDAITVESLPSDELFFGESKEIPETFAVNEAVARRFSTHDHVDRTSRLRRTLTSEVRARLKKTKRRLSRLRGDETKLTAMLEGRRWGELLKPALHKVLRGSTHVEVIDWETGQPVDIALDPKLSAKRNLERFFAKAKKGERGLPVVHERIQRAEREIEAMEAEIAELESADGSALLARAQNRPDDVSTKPRTRSAEAPKADIDRWSRRFETVDGYEVRVGRGAKENDRLTLAVARGHDLWLHARGVPGAHVLLRLKKGESPRQESLLDAAHLAVHHSDAKGEARAEVIYAEARHVKKIKGAPPGQVTVAKEKTLMLRLEPERLARLLGHEQ